MSFVRSILCLSVAAIAVQAVPAFATDVNNQVIMNPDGSMYVNKTVTTPDGTVINKTVNMPGAGTQGSNSLGSSIQNMGAAIRSGVGAVQPGQGTTTIQSQQTINSNANGTATINKNVQFNQGAATTGGAAVQTMGAAMRNTNNTVQNSGTIQSHEIYKKNTINKNVTIDPSVYNGGGVVVNKSATINSPAPALPVMPKAPAAPVIQKSTTIHSGSTINATKTVTSGQGNVLNKQVVIQQPGNTVATGSTININKSVTTAYPSAVAPPVTDAAGVQPFRANADGSVTVTETVLAYYAGTDKDLKFVASQLPRNADGTITIPAAVAGRYSLGAPPASVNKQVTIGNGVININKNIQTNQ